MKEDRKIIYFKDELNDEFSRKQIKTKVIDGNYKYLPKHKFWWNLGRLFFYRIIMKPYVKLYCFFHGIKFKGRENFKKVKGGYFIYGNHTQEIADAYIPNVAASPKGVYVIVHPNNVSIPVLGKINPFLGALPLPSDIAATKNFIKAVEYRIEKNKAVVIYPEAHIWPYYTKIRPYTEASFRYPVKQNVPAFSMTTTYQKGKKNKPKITVYIDGPFYPDNTLSKAQAEKKLRDAVYNKMCERATLSDYEYIKYQRAVDND